MTVHPHLPDAERVDGLAGRGTEETNRIEELEEKRQEICNHDWRPAEDRLIRICSICNKLREATRHELPRFNGGKRGGV
eukprot:1215828-Rhodomonas_salina.1